VSRSRLKLHFDEADAARLSKFSWGHGFYKMNSHLIERYRKCYTADEIQAEQEKIQAEMEEEAKERKARKGQFGSFRRLI